MSCSFCHYICGRSLNMNMNKTPANNICADCNKYVNKIRISTIVVKLNGSQIKVPRHKVRVIRRKFVYANRM